jgi:hypothetical protein
VIVVRHVRVVGVVVRVRRRIMAVQRLVAVAMVTVRRVLMRMGVRVRVAVFVHVRMRMQQVAMAMHVLVLMPVRMRMIMRMRMAVRPAVRVGVRLVGVVRHAALLGGGAKVTRAARLFNFLLTPRGAV